MSHLATIKTALVDLDVLSAVCPTRGLEFVLDQKTFRSFAGTMHNCDHAIRMKGNNQAYEVGIVRSRDGSGYTLLFDEFNGARGMVEAVGGQRCEGLIQDYDAEVARRTADIQNLINNMGCVENIVTDPTTGDQYLVYQNDGLSQEEVQQYILQR